MNERPARQASEAKNGPICGYSDRRSGHPGETIAIEVSSQSTRPHASTTLPSDDPLLTGTHPADHTASRLPNRLVSIGFASLGDFEKSDHRTQADARAKPHDALLSRRTTRDRGDPATLIRSDLIQVDTPSSGPDSSIGSNTFCALSRDDCRNDGSTIVRNDLSHVA